ncbi:MAG: choice-of-anchor D domain-containing protein, partial [Propionivibrio sp.]|nr:choice-of-anchor D domain-containing protein [Propionivibrio sp.]
MAFLKILALFAERACFGYNFRQTDYAVHPPSVDAHTQSLTLMVTLMRLKFIHAMLLTAFLGTASASAVASSPSGTSDPLVVDNLPMLNLEDLVIRVPANVIISDYARIRLASGQMLPKAMVGVPYSFDLSDKVTIQDSEGADYTAVSWAMMTPAPAGLTLSSNGVISGTPIDDGSSTFEVAVFYKTASDTQVFVMEVGVDVLVALSPGTPPVGFVGTTYPGFNARNLLTVEGDPSFNIDSVTWKVKEGSVLPAGLVLNSTTGMVTGVPTAIFSGPVTIVAIYKGKEGLRDYDFVVNMNVSPSLQVQRHPDTAPGQPSTAMHTLKNPTSSSITIGAQSVSGSAFTYVSKTCGASLASGGECTITTRCQSSAEGEYTGTLTLPTSSSSLTGALSCAVIAPSFSISPVGEQSTRAGGWSKPINWYAVSNNGDIPVKITALTAANANWKIISEPGNTAHCQLNQDLPPGAQCTFGEQLLNADPGTGGSAQFVGQHTIATNAGNKTVSGNITAEGVTITGITPISLNQYGETISGSYLIKNNAPDTLSSLNISTTGDGFSVASSTCNTSLSAGASCQAVINHTAGLSGSSSTGTIKVSGAYPQRVNNIPGALSDAGQQGLLSQTVSLLAPNIVMTSGVFPNIGVGEEASVVHTVQNKGTLPVSIVGSPSLSNSTSHTIESTTCATSLAPGATCEIVTKYSPTSSSGLSATLSLPLSGVIKTLNIQGSIWPESEVAVNINTPTDIHRNGNTSFSVWVTNGTAGPAKVDVLLDLKSSAPGVIQSAKMPTCHQFNGVICDFVDNSKVSFTIPANTSASLTQSLLAGDTPGTITLDAAIEIAGVKDINALNNNISKSLNVIDHGVDMLYYTSFKDVADADFDETETTIYALPGARTSISTQLAVLRPNQPEISQNLPQTGAAFCADGSYKYRKIHAENGGLWILGTCDLPSNAEIPQGFVLKMNASTLQVEHFAYMDQIIDRTYYTKNTTVSFPGGQDITGDRRYYQRMGHLVDFRSVESCSSPNITVKPKAGQDTSLCVADGIGVRNVDSFAWPFYFTTYIYVDSKKTNLGDPRVMVCGSEKNCMFQQYVATNPSSLLQTVIDPASGSVAFRKQVGQYNP